VYLGGVVSAVGLLVLAVLLLPQTQQVLYHTVVASPSTIWYGTLGTLATVGLYRYTGSSPRRRNVLVAVVGATLLFAFVLGPAVGNAYANADLAQRTESETTALQSVPETSETHLRTVPKTVAERSATAAVEDPGYGPRDGRLSYHNGSYVWSFPLAPDELLTRLVETQRGVVYVAADGSSERPTVRNTRFRNGVGQYWLDAYEYQTMLAAPLLDDRPATRFAFEHDGTPYLAKSYVRHRWQFRLFPLPQPYAVPSFAGVQLMDQEGRTEFVPAERVTRDRRLTGQAVYPPSLVRRRITALAYRNGVLARFLGSAPAVELGDFPTDGQWPVVAPTGNESQPALTYFLAVKAAGTEGVSQVWAVDSQTGEAGVVQFRESRIGADRAATFVSQSDSLASFGGTSVSPPVPVSVDGALHWQITTTASGSGGESTTGFVDAVTGKTTLADSATAAKELVESGALAGDRGGGGGSSGAGAGGGGSGSGDAGGTDGAGGTGAGDGGGSAGTDTAAVNGSLNGTDGSRNGTVTVPADDGSVTVSVVVVDANGSVVDRRVVSVPEGGSVGVRVSNPENETTGGKSTESDTP
jgi:hypothetical protein